MPSATETLLAWGVTPVAVTRFCEQPSLPHVGGTKDPDIAAIASLAPDVVVLCDQENRLPDAEALQDAGLRIHVISITHVDHVAPQMRSLASTLELADGLPGTEPVPPDVDDQCTDLLRAYIPIWKRPWMTVNGDTYGSSLLASAGMGNVCADHADRYPTIDLPDVIAMQPDVVLAPSEPYPFKERHRALLESVAPAWFIDGQDLFWWGARTPAAHQRLSAVVAEVRRQLS